MTTTGSLTPAGYPSFVDIQNTNGLFGGKFFTGAPLVQLSSSEKCIPWEVSETGDTVTIRAELAGVEEKNIQIKANKDFLSIETEKHEESSQEGKTYHLREVNYGKFSRGIRMPFEIDPQNTKAVFKNGVLTVSITKPVVDAHKPKSIPVSTGK